MISSVISDDNVFFWSLRSDKKSKRTKMSYFPSLTISYNLSSIESNVSLVHSVLLAWVINSDNEFITFVRSHLFSFGAFFIMWMASFFAISTISWYSQLYNFLKGTLKYLHILFLYRLSITASLSLVIYSHLIICVLDTPIISDNLSCDIFALFLSSFIRYLLNIVYSSLDFLSSILSYISFILCQVYCIFF